MSSPLAKLEEINHKLENIEQISRQELLEMKVIQESQELVYRVGADSETRQKLPFKKLYLPMACTGILEPKKAVDDNHCAIQILLPGTGTTFSIAETLCDVAGTFHGRKSKNRGQGLVTMIRHVHLVLSKLYPHRPVFVAGRSQGGIASILYAQHYGDVAGAIAVNPPHPDPELFEFTVTYLEDKAEIIAELLHAPGVTLHEPSWNAYKTFTPEFDYPSRQSLSPILVLVSLGDPFNLFPQYAHAQKDFAEKDEKCQVKILDAGHNLWDRKSVDTYREVINLQAQFMLSKMAKNSNA